MIAINRRIEVLRCAVTTCDGYRHVIEDMRHDDDDNNKDDKQLTSYDIFNLRRKSLYLLKFYETCKEEMPQKQ